MRAAHFVTTPPETRGKYTLALLDCLDMDRQKNGYWSPFESTSLYLLLLLLIIDIKPEIVWEFLLPIIVKQPEIVWD